MSDAELDKLIRAALLEAAEKDQPEEEREPAFSEDYRRARAALLEDPAAYRRRRRPSPAWKRTLQTAACLMVAAGVCFGGLMAVNPAARAWVSRLTMEWFDTHASFDFGQGTGETETLGVWRITRLPEGFAETASEQDEEMLSGSVTYENADGAVIELRYDGFSDHKAFSYSVDNEHADYYEREIGGHQVSLFIGWDGAGGSHAIWVDEGREVAFVLGAYWGVSLDLDQMIDMVESVSSET